MSGAAKVNPPFQGTSRSAKLRRARREALQKAGAPKGKQKQNPQKSKQPQQAKTSQPSRTKPHMSFLRCVVDPINHASVPLGVPDRFSGFSFPIELKQVVTVSTVKGKVGRIILLPGNLLIFSGVTYDGAEVPADTYYGVTFAPELDEMAETGRIISIAVRAINVTEQVRKGGAIYAARIPTEVGSPFVNSSAVRVLRDETIASAELKQGSVKTQVVTDVKPSYVTVRQAVNDGYIYRWVSSIQASKDSLVQSVDTKVLPMEAGAYVVGTRVGADAWDFQSVRKFVPTVSQENQAIAQLVTKGAQTMTLFDPNWTAPMLLIDTPTQEQTLVLEARVCLELTPISSSWSITRALAHRSPGYIPGALDEVARLQEKMPVAVSATESFWDKVTGTAWNVGKAAGRYAGRAASAYFGGVGGVIAGIADLAIDNIPNRAAIGW